MSTSKFRSPMEFVEAATTNQPPPAPKPPAPPADAVAPVAPAPPAKTPMPWDLANPRVKVPFTVRMNEPLHAKLAWVAERMPSASMHSIMVDAATEKLDALIRELEKK